MSKNPLKIYCLNRATDCLNGTLLKQSELPHPYMNFTQFWKIYENSNEVLDPNEM